jgi:hypothetical protein
MKILIGVALACAVSAQTTPALNAPQVDAPQVDAPQLDAVQLDATQLDAAQRSAPQLDTPPPDKMAYGVLPNFRTAEGSTPFSPLTAKQKITIGWKDTMNFPSYAAAGFFAGISQLNNTNPSFGQGLQGYAHRYITGVADQDLGNMLTEGFLPSLFHEDPRFFRKGTGGAWSRVGYAASRVLVTRTDKGNWRFNTSEFLGNGTVAALGNLYYPDGRSAADTAQRMFTQIGTDALSNVLKEFWPDVKKWYKGRSARKSAPAVVN